MPASDDPTRGLSAAILAGGRARRLGGADKWALVVGGQRIVDRHITLLRRLAAHVFIVGHTPARFASLQVEVVTDLVPDAGPLGGVWSALAASPAPLVLVVACDLPLVTEALARHLADTLGRHPEADVVVPRDARGLHPLCACYRTRCAPHFEARVRAGQFRMLDALAGLAVAEVDPETLRAIDPDGRALTNVNTPEDYAAIRLAE